MTHHLGTGRTKAHALSIAAIAMGLTSVPSIGSAGPFFVGAGYDYYRGPSDQVTQGPVGVAGVEFGLTSAWLGAMRYDDNQAGNGASVSAGLGLPVLPMTQLRANATRYASDGDADAYRAWRVKVGPQFEIPTGQSLGVFYSRYTDNREVEANGATAELSAQLGSALTGRVAAAYSSAGGFNSGQGSLGLSWRVVRNLEVSGDVGLAQTGALATQPFPQPGVALEPLLGGTTSANEERTRTESTVLLGMRVFLP